MSRYHLIDVPDAAALLAGLAATLGVDVVVAKRRRLLQWENVRIHLDDVEGLGRFVELEAVAAPGADLERERAKVERLREALDIRDGDLRAGSYARCCSRGRQPDPELLALAREAAGRAYAPYSQLPRRRRACAPPTAAASPAPTSRTPPTRRASAPRRRRSARWWPAAAGGWSRWSCGAARSRARPCGGCRQRLRSSATGRVVHLAGLERVRARPRSASCCRSASARRASDERAARPPPSSPSGRRASRRASASCSAPASARSPTSSPRPVTIPYGDLPGFSARRSAGTRARSCSAAAGRPRSRACRARARLRGDRRRARSRRRSARCRRSAARRSCSPAPPARWAPRPARAASWSSPTTSTCRASTRSSGPNDEDGRPALPEPARSLRPRAARAAARGGRRAARRCPRASTSPSAARASRPRRRSAPSARWAPTSSACRPCPRRSPPCHCGLRVAAVAAVTNLAEGMGGVALSHEQTLAEAARGAARAWPPLLRRWVAGHAMSRASWSRCSTSPR